MTELKIYIDRLRGDQTLIIDETLPPDFLGVNEETLSFKEPVHIQAKAYLADDHLVIHLSVKTTALLPCCICNTPITWPIQIQNLCLTLPVNEIPGAIFDLGAEVRETILLQPPLFLECSGGTCPERTAMKKFFKTEKSTAVKPDNVNFPFAGLGE